MLRCVVTGTTRFWATWGSLMSRQRAASHGTAGPRYIKQNHGRAAQIMAGKRKNKTHQPHTHRKRKSRIHQSMRKQDNFQGHVLCRRMTDTTRIVAHVVLPLRSAPQSAQGRSASGGDSLCQPGTAWSERRIGRPRRLLKGKWATANPDTSASTRRSIASLA